MKLVRVLGLGSLLFGATAALSDQVIGNGGDLVICRDAVTDAIVSSEPLDVFEARVTRGLVVNLPAEGSEIDTAMFAIGRIKDLDPSRYLSFRRKIESFYQDVSFVEHADLVDIPDTGPLPFKPHCKVEQLIIQTAPRFPFEKRYLISRPLWESLTVIDKAVMILHEVILGDAVGMGHTNSMASRYYNSLVFSGAIDSLSRQSYAEMMSAERGLKFGIRDVDVERDVRAPAPGGQFRILVVHELLAAGEHQRMCASIGYQLMSDSQWKIFLGSDGGIHSLVGAKILESFKDSRGLFDFSSESGRFCDGRRDPLKSASRSIVMLDERGRVNYGRTYRAQLTDRCTPKFELLTPGRSAGPEPVGPAFGLCFKKVKSDEADDFGR